MKGRITLPVSALRAMLGATFLGVVVSLRPSQEMVDFNSGIKFALAK